MYATVYACIRRNTSKILPSCYCLKPVVKLTLSIWNDTIKLNILQGRSHKFYSYMVNNSSSRKRYASPKAGTELYLDLVFRQ